MSVLASEMGTSILVLEMFECTSTLSSGPSACGYMYSQKNKSNLLPCFRLWTSRGRLPSGYPWTAPTTLSLSHFLTLLIVLMSPVFFCLLSNIQPSLYYFSPLVRILLYLYPKLVFLMPLQK